MSTFREHYNEGTVPSEQFDGVIEFLQDVVDGVVIDYVGEAKILLRDLGWTEAPPYKSDSAKLKKAKLKDLTLPRGAR